MASVPKDHAPLEQKMFRGLYSRGVEAAPDSYFSDCLNVQFGTEEVLTRDGCELKVTKGSIIRKWAYKRLNENPRFIILDSSGNLLDSLAPGTPIWTDASFVDFSLINYNNRAYITAHNRLKGIAGKSLLVYEGTGNARLAGGTAPTGFTLLATDSVLSGSVEAGIHLVAVAFLTSSGFITAPGPLVFARYTAVGGMKLYVNNIPIGGANTAGRVILATKAIPVTLFNGNQFGYELFFVPSGVILNNTDTDGTFNFFDADLQDSADYLIDNLATIPAGLGLAVYGNRLCIWAEDANEFTIRVSEPGQPEVFSSLSGFITVDPSDSASGVRNVTEHRKTLLIGTSNRLYSSTDNGSDPSTWRVDIVDKSSGVECFGFATNLDARGSNTDRIFTATQAGLISFEGYIRRPEMSWNIENVWKRINKAIFNLVQVVDDPTNHRLIISVPLDSAIAISHLLLADYSEAFTVYGTIDEKLIKWAIWSFPTAPVSLVGDIDSVTKSPVLYVALVGGNIYSIKSGLTDDFGNAIDSYIDTSFKTAQTGWICHFGGLKLRITGIGTLLVTCKGLDDSNPVVSPPFALLDNPGVQPHGLLNYINERVSLRLRTHLINERFSLTNLILYGRNLWLRRPL